MQRVVEGGFEIDERGDLGDVWPLGWAGSSEAIEPDRVEPCGDRAVDVAGHAVADHGRLSSITVERCQDMMEGIGVGFADAEVAGDDDHVEEVSESRCVKLLALQA